MEDKKNERVEEIKNNALKEISKIKDMTEIEIDKANLIGKKGE